MPYIDLMPEDSVEQPPAPKITKLPPAGRSKMLGQAAKDEYEEFKSYGIDHDPKEEKARIKDDLDINRPGPFGKDKPTTERPPEDLESQS